MAGEMQYNVKPAPEWSRNTDMFQWLGERLTEIRDSGHEFGADDEYSLPDDGSGPEPAQLLPPEEPPGEGEIRLPRPEHTYRRIGGFAIAA